MSFWKKLFGLDASGSSRGAEAPAPTETHDGFTIAATPFENGGRWQLCGVISKEIDGALKEHRFIRADAFDTRQDAERMTFAKARQMIAQMGDGALSSP
ncbi:MAG: hypothetical protein JWN93_3034 [Hyphomicrobiales bacterium]|nr:hypothetical protein [Hyphomicrobiales bacterium]